MNAKSKPAGGSQSQRGPAGRSKRPGGSKSPKRPGRGRARPASKSGKATPLAPGEGMRLQRFIAQAGVTSRRKAEALMLAGEVRVNGKIVSELGTRVDPERDDVVVHGRRLTAGARVYYLLNKPDGVVCSAAGVEDELGRPTILSLFPGIQQKIFPVGRLDYHTRGLVIVTNDGGLAAKLTHPRAELLRVYHVKFQGKLTPAVIERLISGVELEDGTVTRRAEEVIVIRETETNTWVQLGIKQGLNRQIRRMGTAVGHEVLKLICVGIGDLVADELEDGRFRRLSGSEVGHLIALGEGLDT